MLKLLVVEDEVELLELYDLILGKDYTVFTTDSGKEAINIFDRENPEVLIVDIRLPDISGIEVTKHAKSKNPKVAVIAVSAYRERFKEAIDAGAATVIQKPFLVKQIHNVIEDVLNNKQ
ncbi:MAG: acetoacetate metabolism regulatory protein AtoC [Candidatus Methanofastidiosum methylothiophilum]|uniref:Acetoacetate metabolism regulatory protein AtoC n=1 Tax=Candidatus Methanofastidiosum methylothiophilum TaxID=1705564 RepID=A0A150J0I0_9EURY|nr:MAG: acetoacetate metabolism regulatory protein AtoC [Candidatus Methanofastidiosum methylthiophilus]KYC48031.1 MAG: acetoacetate metabolism regulatory protein AtoC [Candidatus Methanofastidiosum methylthiophilus]KYC50721.1 MAG: acetoacetate metabolism regulatory protein AtoC [Candidatus Methanofastidiosum methylthiophilus]